MGYKRNYAPVSAMEFLLKSNDMLARFTRLDRGDKRYFAPMSPIELPDKLSDRLYKLMR